MNGWILRPYPHGINRMTQFLEENFIAVGWPGIGNLYSCNRSCVYQKVVEFYIEDYGDEFCRESSNIITRFNDKMRIGELVLVIPRKEDSLEVAVGLIDSSYFFDRKYDETGSLDTGYNGFSHRRKVIWLEKKFPKRLLPDTVKKTLIKPSLENEALFQMDLEGCHRLVDLLESNGYNLQRWEMSQHRKQLIKSSIKVILETMNQKTPELTKIVEKIALDIFQIFQETESPHFDLLRNKLVHLATGAAASVIPIDVNLPCQKHCLSLALHGWHEKEGFCEVAKQTMTYWLECLNENTGTIFFTSAWDEVDFIAHYKSQFDAYAKKHDVVVILVTANGFLITYI
ncbi:hypothetical protein [Candidatus Parabeggiatoa sp. HSG14]|uniref:hypothetical protein n=1 Tax=Candidatus Parabeggiatoa sp. HSG14 TaxID=3055593 RepID=UPI0025A84B6F|nr:hypothetical protein [Thiotrichales bacterium HSG14]